MSKIHIYHTIPAEGERRRLLAHLCKIHDCPETRAEYGITSAAIMAELKVPESKDWCFRCQEIQNLWRTRK